MKTLIVCPKENQQSLAYIELDTGEIWGPMAPVHPVCQVGMWSDPWGYAPAGQLCLAAGKTFDGLVREIAGQSRVEIPLLNAGEYHPRIWHTGQEIEKHGRAIPRVEDSSHFVSFVHSLEQIEGLLEGLGDIFRVVHGEAANLGTFGSAIRDIIILACTEIENQWKGILEANHVITVDARSSTKDYVKLVRPMKLHEYEVALIRYPRIAAIRPFSGWDSNRPTASLPWYDAYNHVKHGREVNFSKAKLHHAIESVAGCVVLLAAQYGFEALQVHQLKNLFEFRQRPMWEPKEWYYAPAPNRLWAAIDHPM